jgi:NAD(P)-dependent dehydrogenase (short-subunit alcohol dehydrogenase family)
MREVAVTNRAHDRVAVVTGAAGGLGLGIARAAATEGMAVVVSDVDEERLDRVATELTDAGYAALAAPADVTDPVSMQGMVRRAVAEFGRIDIICLNAGISPVSMPIDEVTQDVWRRVMAVNLDGVVNGVNAVLPVMRRQGHGHVNATASVNGLMADPGIAAYNASKFAVVGFMETLMLDLNRERSPISASVLCPGPVATDIIKRAVGSDRGTSDEEHALLNRGMDPNHAGKIALDGIRSGRFWIFTHPVMADVTLRRRFEAMVSNGSRPALLEWPWDEILDQET